MARKSLTPRLSGDRDDHGGSELDSQSSPRDEDAVDDGVDVEEQKEWC